VTSNSNDLQFVERSGIEYLYDNVFVASSCDLWSCCLRLGRRKMTMM